MKLDEFQAQMAIIYRQYSHSFCLPNYTPVGWWECDVFEVTSAGYFREYEVKLTHSDFVADKRKAMYSFGMNNLYKHDLLQLGDNRGPSRFYYVTPSKLISTEEIPPWAGLIELSHGNGLYRSKWIRHVVKKAPILHRRKIRQTIVDQAKEGIYHRYHEALIRRWVDMEQERQLCDEPLGLPTKPHGVGLLDASENG